MFTFPLLLTIYAGFTHAFETDHLLAVGTIVSRRNRLLSAMKDGLFWGMGHLSTILLIGILMILFKVAISERSFHYFEAAVGAMLILLAITRLAKLARNGRVAGHHHAHPPLANSLASAPRVPAARLLPGNIPSLRPVSGILPAQEIPQHDHSHHLAYGVGLVHGLAGSGALVVLVMAQLRHPLDGLLYLLTFGSGCAVGMLTAAGLFSVPFSKKLVQAPILQVLLVVVTSLFSLWFGGLVVYDNLVGGR